ncbi:hypothetical protein MHK_001150, partial [Candidatus Magnetomorum sp. HK-1]
QYHHFNVVPYWFGNGKSYDTKYGLITLKNKVATIRPRPGDTISFENCTSSDDIGHVAIISEVDNERIFFYQQNVALLTHDQLAVDSVSYSIDSENGSIHLGDYNFGNTCLSVIGWATPSFSVVKFSRGEGVYNSVFGILDKPLYSQIKTFNNDSEPIELKGTIQIENSDGDISNFEDNYTINGNSQFFFTKQNIQNNLPESTSNDHTYTFLFDFEHDDESVLHNVVKRKLIFSFVHNDSSVIIDDSQRNEGFFISDPIGIANWSEHSSYYKRNNLKINGYLYGSILVNSNSKVWAQWKPEIEGTYSIEVFIPSNGCNQTVQYKIKPDGTDDNCIISKSINQNDYNNEWVKLKDINDNHLWLFNKNGYVGLFADYVSGKKIGFDAIRFTYHSTKPVKGWNKGIVKVIGSDFGNTTGSVLVTSTVNNFYADVKSWSEGEIELDIFRHPLNDTTFEYPVRLEIRNSSNQLIDSYYYPFRDVEPGQWFSYYTTKLWKNKVISGKGKSCFFAPGENTNFAEFFTMLINSSSKLFPNNQSCEGKEWYCPYLNNSSVLSWIDDLREIDSTRGEPSNLIKRQEVAFFLARAVDIPWVTNLNDIGFNDVQSSNQFAQYIVKCKELNIFNGYPDGNFKPDQYITRAEIAKVLYRTFYENNIEFSMFINN